MRLDITELLREVGRQLSYDINEPPLVDEDVECVQPITGSLTFTNTGGLLLIKGKAQTAVALSCCRCTEYFEWPVSLLIDEQFELRHVVTGPRSLATVTIVEEDVSPIAGKLFDGQVFDLTEALRQYILLAEPTQPQPDIAKDGRCVQCHRTPDEVLLRFNEIESAPVNPALAKLGRLIQNGDGE